LCEDHYAEVKPDAISLKVGSKKCSICGSTKGIVKHHMDYENNVTIEICSVCHRHIHALDPKIKFIENPFDLADGDWAVGTYENRTFLYSRYPRNGGQLVFKYPCRFDRFGSGKHGWDGFILRASVFVRNNASQYLKGIVNDLNKLRGRFSG